MLSLDKRQMIYLATPYWHEEEIIRTERVRAAALLTRALIRRGLPVFSPIVHSHTLNHYAGADVKKSKLPLSNQDWINLDFMYLGACNMMLVAQIHGWRESSGIKQELEFCTKMKIPVTMMLPYECGILMEQEDKTSTQPE